MMRREFEGTIAEAPRGTGGFGYDAVFIDTAPLLLVSHATILAPKVDALITIARSDTLTRPMVKRLQDALDGLPVYKAGMVLTNAESTLDYRYGVPPTAGSSDPAATRT